MRILIIAMCLGSIVTRVCLAAEAMSDKDELSRAERIYIKTGGRIFKPGTRTGKILIINAQSRVKDYELDSAAGFLRDVMLLNASVTTGSPVTVENAASVKSSLNAEVAVFVVDDAKLPVSLVAREERWAIFNVNKLELEKIDSVMRFGRTKAELLRIIAHVCGSGDSQFPTSLMCAGDKISDLDKVDADLPIDVMNRMSDSLRKIGVTPAVKMTYRAACQEGWAPAPTNDIQKAIWDKVNAAPKTPMKIEFDPKKGR